jgi:hypothetical protein
VPERTIPLSGWFERLKGMRPKSLVDRMQECRHVSTMDALLVGSATATPGQVVSETTNITIEAGEGGSGEVPDHEHDASDITWDIPPPPELFLMRSYLEGFEDGSEPFRTMIPARRMVDGEPTGDLIDVKVFSYYNTTSLADAQDAFSNINLNDVSTTPYIKEGTLFLATQLDGQYWCVNPHFVGSVWAGG